MRPLTVVAMLALALAAGAGCKKDRDGSGSAGQGEQPADQGPPPISSTEADRGRKACRAFKEKVCAEAEQDRTKEDACHMAGSRIEALEMQLDALAAEGGDAEQRRVVQANARKIMKGCIEALAKRDE